MESENNWASVARVVRQVIPFVSDRDPEWFTQQRCASTYNELLESLPKRKRSAVISRGSVAEAVLSPRTKNKGRLSSSFDADPNESPALYLAEKYTYHRVQELNAKLIEDEKIVREEYKNFSHWKRRCLELRIKLANDLKNQGYNYSRFDELISKSTEEIALGIPSRPPETSFHNNLSQYPEPLEKPIIKQEDSTDHLPSTLVQAPSHLATESQSLLSEGSANVNAIEEKTLYEAESNLAETPSFMEGVNYSSMKDDRDIEEENRRIQKPLLQAMQNCLKIVNRHRFAGTFRNPVTEAIAPGYLSIVEHPICLNDIKQKLKTKEIGTPDQLEAAFKLMIENCHKYNGHGSEISNQAAEIYRLIEKELGTLRKTEAHLRNPTNKKRKAKQEATARIRAGNDISELALNTSSSGIFDDPFNI